MTSSLPWQCCHPHTLLFSVVFIAPGVTSYQGYNMGFRIYTIDGDYANSSHALLDHQSWYMDLAQANKDNATKWEYEYSAKVGLSLPRHVQVATSHCSFCRYHTR